MFAFRRKNFFVYLVLILLVCSLVLAGCRSSLPPQDEGNGNGNGNGGGDEDEDKDKDKDKNGEGDLSWLQGTWRSSDLDPSIEFTIGELIERVPNEFVEGMFDYYFKGEIKSPWLAGGERIITEKPDWPAKKDKINVLESINSETGEKDTSLLYVWGGHDLENSNIVQVVAPFEGKKNSFDASVVIKDKDGETLYNSFDELEVIKFTKVSSP